MTVRPSQFLLNPVDTVPPQAPEPPPAQPSTALAPARPSLPAPAPTSGRALARTDYALPFAAGSAWLLTLGLAVAQSTTLPVLAAVGAAGLGSVLVMGRSLLRQAPQARPAADPAMAQTHFHYATDDVLDANLRTEHAYKFVRCVPTLQGADADKLFAGLPRGREWGIVWGPFGNGRYSPVTYHKVLKSIGLRKWRQPAWMPYDVELVIAGLNKLGPVTAAQRASIERNALDIIGSFHGRHNAATECRADLVAAVRELVRRAPSADATPD